MPQLQIQSPKLQQFLLRQENDFLSFNSKNNNRIYCIIFQQVLFLNVKDKINQRLIIERKVGGALDWKFVSVQGSEIKDVWAHRTIVIKYSPKMRKMVEVLAEGGIERNCGYPIN